MGEHESRRVAGRAHALVRLRPPLAHLTLTGAPAVIRHAPHASATRPAEVRPPSTAGDARIMPLCYRPRPRFHSAKCLYRLSNLTPGITRRPERFDVNESVRVGGRVHAVVMLRALQHARVL